MHETDIGVGIMEDYGNRVCEECMNAPAERDRLRQQNAGLVEVLKRIEKHFDMDGYGVEAWKNLALEMAEAARAALAKYDQPEPEYTKAKIL